MHSLCLLIAAVGMGLERPDVEFQVFQFPADQIPRIDGNADDWSIVPDTYAIRSAQLRETVVGIVDKHEPATPDVQVTVGGGEGRGGQGGMDGGREANGQGSR